MLAKTESVALIGTEARIVEVEVHVGGGVPAFRIVGLPAKSVTEAEQRTRAALLSSDQRWPPHRITANLAPGALRKEGTHFDLALALGTLVADKQLPAGPLDGWLLMGELGLDGSVRQVRGVLAASMTCRRRGRKGIICPIANAAEAAIVDGVDVVPVASIRDCLDFVRGVYAVPPIPAAVPHQSAVLDLCEVRGQTEAKRALEIAAAGGHNVVMTGPPGSGKTMLARCLPGILPAMTHEESLDVTTVYSVAGLLPERGGLISERPFRSPHHHVSLAGLIGGGVALAQPGEISLAHHGVLFMDEISLYRGEVLEALRAPLEDGRIRIARSAGMVSFPCRFSLVAAMNPCPCGYLGDLVKECRCSDLQIERYDRRLSGPLLDRIDIETETFRLTKEEIFGPPDGEPTEMIRARVETARAIQQRRYGSSRITNASVPRNRLHANLRLDEVGRKELSIAIDSLVLSGRGVDRVLRVARTIADLRCSETIEGMDVEWALSLRTKRERLAA